MNESNPSPFQLPQDLSDDRQRARQLTISLHRQRYPLQLDAELPGKPRAHLPLSAGVWPGASRMRKLLTRCVDLLPPKEAFLSELPPESRFSRPKLFRHGTHAGSMKLRQLWARLSNIDFRPASEQAYERLMGTIPPPRIKDTWEADREFARQRLAGVNPMEIRRCTTTPGQPLAKAADRFLKERHSTTFSRALKSGRVFMTEYPLLWEEPVQQEVRRNASLAAPTCLFYVDDTNTLMPLAIQLKPRDVTEGNPVFTPLNEYWDWRLARAHAQAADSHHHEAVAHLLETHLVSEIFALATHRHLHPDHPLTQLLEPHFLHTLAINEQARKNLLAEHGEIAKCMAAKHTGNINLVRLVWADWQYDEHHLLNDLEKRDVLDGLPGYLYRDDSLEVFRAIRDYAHGVLSIWYTSDAEVRNDNELQDWAREISDPNAGRIHGFPESIETREQLFAIATSVIFRASAQHAAVNNGQFGTYGWIPNAPVAYYHDLPDELPENAALLTERGYYSALPDRERTFGQSGMVWLLSEPTMDSLLRSGDRPAFSREHCFEAWLVVGRFRRRLKAISDAIDARNGEIGFEYNYLKPQNIDQSISI